MPGPSSATTTRTTLLAGVELRLDDDVAAALHRLDGVVDQVDDDAADLLGVEPHQRHAGREPLLDPDIGEDPVVERERVGDELRRDRSAPCAATASARTARTRRPAPSATRPRRRWSPCTRRRAPVRRGGAPAKCRRSRSADSWIGVSGFLISCASRRATSRQAATFCARISGVTSSSTSTTPFGRAAVADERPSRRRPGAAPARRAAARSPARPAPSCRARRRRAASPSGCRSARSNTARAGWPTICRFEAQQPRRGAVDRGDRAGGVDRDDAGRDALEDRLDVAPAAFDLDVLALELDRRALDLAAARRQLAGHRVERFDERAELVVALRLDALIEAAGADLARGRRQHLHRARDPLGEVEAHPGGADQNHAASPSGRTTGRRRSAAA